MRIAHISSTFPPYMGGTGNVCYYNACELAKLGHEVHVYTVAYPGAPSQENMHAFTVHRLAAVLQFGNASIHPNLLQLSGFDIVHLHYPFFGGEFAALNALRSQTPLVITYHMDVVLSGWLGVFRPRPCRPALFDGWKRCSRPLMITRRFSARKGTASHTPLSWSTVTCRPSRTVVLAASSSGPPILSLSFSRDWLSEKSS